MGSNDSKWVKIRPNESKQIQMSLNKSKKLLEVMAGDVLPVAMFSILSKGPDFLQFDKIS